MTDLGPTAHYLGVEETRSDDTITATRTVYIDQLLAAHQVSNHNTPQRQSLKGYVWPPPPMNSNLCLQMSQRINDLLGAYNGLWAKLGLELSKLWRKQHNAKPTDQFWIAVVHLLRYFKGTRTSGIKLGGGDLISYDYSDSSWVDDLYNLRSIARYVSLLNNCSI